MKHSLIGVPGALCRRSRQSVYDVIVFIGRRGCVFLGPRENIAGLSPADLRLIAS